MSYEPSEIMFAAAMLCETDELKNATKDKQSLEQFMSVIIQKASTGVVFGSKEMRDGFLDSIKKDNLKDLAVGISAAKGVKSKATSMERKYTPKVYMTGNKWPSQVAKFRVNIGSYDYNSADIMFSYDGARYYGVSLKKKNTPNASDPTMINKVFDSLLEGPTFESIKEELYQARVDFFSNLVIEAVSRGIIKKEHIKDFDKLRKTKEGREELFIAKRRDKKLFDRAYINVEGYADAKGGGYANKNTKDPKSMRYFVNKTLANTNNQLYTTLIRIMNKYSSQFATALIDVILKTSLYKEMDAKELMHYKFKFYLVTGIGNVTTTGISIPQATVISLDNTLTRLSELQEEYGNNYNIVLDKTQNELSDAATIFCKLRNGNFNLLDIKIRYKGNFTGQPYFTAFISDSFKKLLIK